MTNKQAFELITFLAELSTHTDTLLDRAKSRTLKKAEKFIYEYNEKIEDMRLDNCCINEKSHVLRDSNGDLIFTKEGIRNLQRDLKEFWSKPCLEPFEILQTEDIKGLTNSQIDFLTDHGFIAKKSEQKSE